MTKHCDICKGFFPEKHLKTYALCVKRAVVFVQQGEKHLELKDETRCWECDNTQPQNISKGPVYFHVKWSPVYPKTGIPEFIGEMQKNLLR